MLTFSPSHQQNSSFCKVLKFRKSGKVVLPDQITLASALKWCFAEKAAQSSPRYGHVRRSVQMCFSAPVRFLSHFPSPCPPTGSRVRPSRFHIHSLLCSVATRVRLWLALILALSYPSLTCTSPAMIVTGMRLLLSWCTFCEFPHHFFSFIILSSLRHSSSTSKPSNSRCPELNVAQNGR